MQPFCIKQLESQHGGQRSASGPIDGSKLEHKLLLPPTGGYRDDVDISFSVRNRSGGATIMVHPSCCFTFKGAALTTDVMYHQQVLTLAACCSLPQGKLHVPHDVKRALYACLTAGHIVYRLHPSKNRDRVQLEFCLSQDAFVVDVKGTHQITVYLMKSKQVSLLHEMPYW